MKLHKLVLGELQTNCYILAEEESKKAILIDAPANADLILNLLEENGYTLQEILLTHAHFDHILALAEVKQRTGVPVSVHADDAPFLEDTVLNLAHYINHAWQPVAYDKLLQDGDVICLGKERVQVLHTPGHTQGCVCFLIGDILLSGDTLFHRSVGRVDHPGGDLKQEIQSIKEKLMPLSDDVQVYPGHGPSTTIGEERKENPYLQ